MTYYYDQIKVYKDKCRENLVLDVLREHSKDGWVRMSIADISSEAHMSRPNVKEALNGLIDNNKITIETEAAGSLAPLYKITY